VFNRFKCNRAILLALITLLSSALVLSLLYSGLRHDLRQAQHHDTIAHHSMEASNALSNLREAHLDLQTSVGAYVYTGNPLYLKPYQDALDRLAPTTERLRRLSAQQGLPVASDLEVLQATSQDRVAISQQMRELVDAGRIAEAQAIITTGRSNAPMLRLRSLIKAMDADALDTFAAAHSKAASVRIRLDHMLTAMLGSLAVLAFAGLFTSYQIIRGQADQIETTAALINSVIDPIFVIDGHGVVLQSNAAAQRQFGYTHDQLHGASVSVVLADWQDEDRLAEGLKTLIHKARPNGAVRDYVFRRRNGTRFRGNVSVSISTENGVTRITAVVRPHFTMAEALVIKSSPGNRTQEQARAETVVQLV
jgi:PAS domain S-box-containing protein